MESNPLPYVIMSKRPIPIPSVTGGESSRNNLREEEVQILRGSLVVASVVLIFLLQIRPGYTAAPPSPIPPGFVEVTGPHGVNVLVGPLHISASGVYEREVIVPGRPPFVISTEPGVTPQEIADIYG